MTRWWGQWTHDAPRAFRYGAVGLAWSAAIGGAGLLILAAGGDNKYGDPDGVTLLGAFLWLLAILAAVGFAVLTTFGALGWAVRRRRNR